MKKIGLLFSTIIMVMLFAISANALESTGQCGDNVYWNYTESTKELVIGGNGRMDDYSYGDSPFYNCEIKSVVVDDGVATIGNSAFNGCASLINVTIRNGVTSIGASAFSRCINLTSITIPDSVTAIGSFAFEGCTNLKSIELPLGIKKIGVCAFKNCEQIKSIIIPEGVEYIGYRAFFDCTNLEHVNILEGVTYIDSEAFCNLPNIKSISFPKSLEMLNSQGLSDTLSDIYYAGDKSQWEKIDNVKDEFGDMIDIRIHYNSNELTHPFLSTVTAPNCTDKGYTTHSCECGYSYYSDYVDALGHKYSSEITTPATHLVTGVKTLSCECGDTYTEPVDTLKAHIYKEIIVNPTCTTQGFTTYACECGDSYEDDFINALGHDMGEFIVSKESTCTDKGEKRADCSRCDYFETHRTDIKEHVDENADEYCDLCELYFPSLTCFCVCHAKTIGAFVYKLFTLLDRFFGTRLLEKVFNISDYCVCGLKH